MPDEKTSEAANPDADAEWLKAKAAEITCYSDPGEYKDAGRMLKIANRLDASRPVAVGHINQFLEPRTLTEAEVAELQSLPIRPLPPPPTT